MKSHFTLNLNNKIFNAKLLIILAGVASVTLGATAIPAVLAQSNTPTNQPPRHENWLNLTSEQQAKMQQIHESERSQIDSILTAEQKSQLDAAKQNRQNPRQVFDSLNLTNEQKTQIDAVRRATREQMDAILTAEQRQQMQQHRPGGFGGRGGNRLNLTSDQQAKMQQIHESERSQIDSILTAEQKSQLDAAKQNRQNPRQVFDSLNLTNEQKTQIDAVRRATREQMDAILTAEQRQQMQQNRPSRSNGTQPPQ